MIQNFKGFYTGVGSRETPLHVLYLMSKIAMIFEEKGFILRSGCATGADSAFEDVLKTPSITAEIYIPNKEFPERMNTNYKEHYIIPQEKYGRGSKGLYRQAMVLIHSKKIHKGWQNCNTRVMDLHNRNMFQVLGQDLRTRSNFTICYTANGEKKYEETRYGTGGTATAINASDLHDVEVFNLGNREDYIRLYNFVEKNSRHIDYDRLNNTVVRSSLNPENKKYIDLLDIIKIQIQKKFPELINNEELEIKETVRKKLKY